MRKPRYARPINDGDIYQAIVGYCEELEHKGAYTGNGHHLAQKLALMVMECRAVIEANGDVETMQKLRELLIPEDAE